MPASRAAVISGPKLPRSRTVDVRAADGTRLHTEVFGPDNGYPIVLAHGITCAIRAWSYQIAELARDQSGERGELGRTITGGNRGFGGRAGAGEIARTRLAECRSEGGGGVDCVHGAGVATSKAIVNRSPASNGIVPCHIVEGNRTS